MKEAVTWEGHIHMHIYSLYMLWSAIYIIHNDLEAHLIGSTASNISLICGMPHDPRGEQDLYVTSKSLANKSSSNLGRISTYAHSQNMRVVKHFI